jgi:hypothetical protein
MFIGAAVAKFYVLGSDDLDTIPLKLFQGPSGPKTLSCLEKNGVCYIDSG